MHKGVIKQTVEVQRGDERINEKVQKGCYLSVWFSIRAIIFDCTPPACLGNYSFMVVETLIKLMDEVSRVSIEYHETLLLTQTKDIFNKLLLLCTYLKLKGFEESCSYCFSCPNLMLSVQ